MTDIDPDDLARRQRELDALGPRLTGTAAHNRVIDGVAGELAELGYEVHRDEHRFDRWDLPEGPDSLGLDLPDGPVRISSVFPYSGLTGTAGVTATLRYLGAGRRWSQARGEIAVVEVAHPEFPRDLLVRDWDADASTQGLRNPVLSATLLGPDLDKARKAGVLAVVAVWRDMAEDNARGQYLPFTQPYHDLPALWVAGEPGERLLAAARAGTRATLRMNGSIERHCRTDMVWAVSAGSERSETILVVTHSDGTNGVEENGHLGLLELARHAARQQHRRTFVFVLTTGHLRIPAISSHGQATSAWMAAHPELWEGGPSGARAVAGLCLEHLGARADVEDMAAGTYGVTADTEPELLYATTSELRDMVADTWGAAVAPDPVISAPGPLVHFGEAEPMYERGIPSVALVTAPQYLLALREPGSESLVDVDLMARQIEGFRRLLDRLDAAPVGSLGTVRRPSRFRKVRAVLRLIAIKRRAGRAS